MLVHWPHRSAELEAEVFADGLGDGVGQLLEEHLGHRAGILRLPHLLLGADQLRVAPDLFMSAAPARPPAWVIASA